MKMPEAVTELLAQLPNWTEEQWAAHDARVAAETKQVEARPVIDYVARGLSRRAMLAVDQPLHTDALARMQRWHAEHPREGILVLSGPKGTGKTVAATWWAIATGALCVRAARFAASSRYDHSVRDGWLTARALVLDDLGTEYSDNKGSFNVDLDELIDVKYANLDRLVITTNLLGADFVTRYGERIADRVRECGSWISVTGASMRSTSPKGT